MCVCASQRLKHNFFLNYLPPYILWDRISCWTQSSLIRLLGWPISFRNLSACLHLPQHLDFICPLLCLAFFLRICTQVLLFARQPFTDWASSPVSQYTFYTCWTLDRSYRRMRLLDLISGVSLRKSLHESASIPTYTLHHNIFLFKMHTPLAAWIIIYSVMTLF